MATDKIAQAAGHASADGIDLSFLNNPKLFMVITIIVILGSLAYVFCDKIKPLKTRHAFTIITAVLLVASLALNLAPRVIDNWFISYILALVTTISLIIEKEQSHYKKDYDDSFRKEYENIHVEYKSLMRLAKEKNAITATEYKDSVSLIQQCVNYSLENIRLNMARFYPYFLDDLVGVTNEKVTKKRREFLRRNFQNAHDCVFLLSHKKREKEIYSSIFYNIYKSVRDRFLEPLASNASIKRVPAFIAKEIDDAILGMPDDVIEQCHTSNYNMEDFYTLYQSESPKKRQKTEVRRIFILKDDIDNQLCVVKQGDEESVRPYSPTLPLEQQKLLLLWILEWHKNNNIRVAFIFEDEIKEYQQRKQNVNTLDFSITHIKVSDNPLQHKDIIIKVLDPHSQRTVPFYGIPIKFHSLITETEDYGNTTDDDAEHFRFFNDMWDLSTNKSHVDQVRNKLLTSQWYINLKIADQASIQTLLNSIYPVVP